MELRIATAAPELGQMVALVNDYNKGAGFGVPVRTAKPAGTPSGVIA
jgi:hypothetical protein